MAGEWWRDGVVYQIYPRSFADTDGDGVGNLRGITEHLEYLEWLGVDGVWLNPVTVSPDADWGYDVADYTAVQPVLGTMSDLDALVDEAGRRGIRVLLDLVPNHTSIEHPWFVDARSARDSAYRDWYVWADAKPDGSLPNNWVSSFGGPAWTFDERTGQYYLHNFTPEQPDLNWWNEDVRAEFDRILRFWFDRGVAGFRIDVCHMIVKDRELRDNPPATDADPFHTRMIGQRQVYNACRPEVHDVLRRWRAIADSYDARARARRRDVPSRRVADRAVLRSGRRAASRVRHPDAVRAARGGRARAASCATPSPRSRSTPAPATRAATTTSTVSRPGGPATTPTGRAARSSCC